MKKFTTMVLAVLLILGSSIGVLAYSNDPTAYYGYDYAYGNNYNYNNNYGYGYNNNYYGYCTGVRTSYSDYEYDHSPWFDVYAEEYGITFHLPPNMPIIRSDVFAPIGKAMYQAYEDAGRSFTTMYGVNFKDFTWDYSLYEIAGGLYQRGIMIGYPEDSTVRFANNITRAEFAKVVALVARQNGITTYSNMGYEFTDMVGHWASQYATQCQALGLFVGRGNGYFDPEANVTYQEYVTVMLRMTELANRSNYSMTFEDIAYGISSTMDIDFEDYDYDDDYDDDGVYVTSIKLNPTAVNLQVGDSQTISATVKPTNATNKSLRWKSYNEYVAIVDQNGRIKAVGVGNTTVTATANDGSGIVATIDVNVTAGAVSGDGVTPVVEITGADNVAVGEKVTLTVTVDDDNLANFVITEKDLLGLTGGASINKIQKVSADTYEITLMGVEVSSLALCIDAGVATDAFGNTSATSNEVIIFINSGE